MEKVAIINEDQMEFLMGQEFTIDSYFYPVQDCNGNWIISEQEIDQTTNPDFLWVKELPLTDWCGPYIPISGTTENYFTQFFSGQTNN